MKKQQFNVLSNWVIVEAAPEDKTAKGILLSNPAHTKPGRGRVVAAGPGVADRHGNFIATGVKEGDMVYFDPFTPRELPLANEKYLIIRSTDIYLTL